MRTLGNRLTDVKCRSANAGMHPDGNGLYLQVRQGTHGLTRSWVYRYSTAGKQTWLGLGPYPLVTLAQAREKAIDARRLRLEGSVDWQCRKAQVDSETNCKALYQGIESRFARICDDVHYCFNSAGVSAPSSTFH